MNKANQPPIGVSLSPDVEHLPDRRSPYRARVRWTDPQTKRRRSLSESCPDEGQAAEWIDRMMQAAAGGINPLTVEMSLA